MKVFISKSAEDASWLADFCTEQTWELQTESMISFAPMEFEIPSDAAIIFFSSKNGVRYFLEQNTIPENMEVACIGRETARVLRKHNIEPNYIGDRSGDPKQVGEDFQNFTAGRKIFFPTSNASLHTVANLFPEDQKTIASIYETTITSKKIDESDVYIFSSPSNVRGFLESNKISKGKTVVAWGTITDQTLEKEGIRADYVLESAQKEELLEYLATL